MTDAIRGARPPEWSAAAIKAQAERQTAAIARSRARLIAARVDLAIGAKRLQATVDRALAAGRLRGGSSAAPEAAEFGATLIASISHDLRTPMTAIYGLAETLHVNGEHLDEAMKRRMLERITAGVSEVIRILDQVLDLAGSGGVRRRRTDLALLTASITKAVDVDGREVTVDAGPGVAYVDEVIAGRILRNLLTNAIGHTPPGTPIWIRFVDVADGLEMVVEDAGGGLAARDLRAGAIEVSPVRPGGHGQNLGLGLQIVARLARHHNGRAWTAARVGGGASVHVILGP